MERRLRERTLPLPGWPQGTFVVPAYEGESIVNVPNAVLAAFGAPVAGPPLGDENIARQLQAARQVVLFVVDALGWHQLHRALERSGARCFERLMRHGTVRPLTSVFPSTTAAAMSSYQTGVTPQEHGLVGFRLFLKEFGCVANMIRLSPVVETRPEVLLEAGLKPERFLGHPSIYRRLAQAGVPSYRFILNHIARSGLSRMLPGETETIGYASAADLFVRLRERLSAGDGRAFHFVYWAGVDVLAHRYGPASEEHDAEVRMLSYFLEHELVRRLPPAVARGTVLVLCADHGQIESPNALSVNAARYPRLRRDLVMPPTGEPKQAYLHVKPERVDGLKRYLERQFGEQLVILHAAEALRVGLFGRGPVKAEVPDRIGELLVLPRGRAGFFWPWPHDKPDFIGRHGGLTPEEMLVPLVVASLDV